MRNSIVLGEIDIQIEADISNCLLLSEQDNEKSSQVTFRKDGIELQVIGTMVPGRGMETRFVVNDMYKEGSLKNRVVKAGDSFSLVKSNSGNELIIWGDMANKGEPRILPTYTPVSGTPAIDAASDSGFKTDLYGLEIRTGTARDLGSVESDD